MGCDIHLYVEKKVNGAWEAVKGENPRIKDYRGHAKNQRERGNEEQALRYEKTANDIESGKALEEIEDDDDKDYYAPQVLKGWAYKGRNYDLFAILADVRNGYGFAGSYTGEGFKPMSEAKGMPDDVSDLIKKGCDDYGRDGHSHSWHSVKDLIEYGWDQVTVSLKPGFYSMSTPIEELKGNTEESLYKDCAGRFYTDTIPKLKELAGEDLESVRLVFWFDN